MFLASWCRFSRWILSFIFRFFLLLLCSESNPSTRGMGTPPCQLKPEIYWVSSVYSMYIQVLSLHAQGASWQESTSLKKTNYLRSSYPRPLFLFSFFFMDTKFPSTVNWNSTLYVSGRLWKLMEWYQDNINIFLLYRNLFTSKTSFSAPGRPKILIPINETGWFRSML